MTIKHQGGIFGRNPTFNNVDVDGVLTVDTITEKTGASGVTLDGVTLKDGNVVLANGKGIDFSATSGTGTSELFDDYEEGTWTPVYAPTTGAFTAITSVATGRYTKIGRLIHLSATIYTSGTLTVGTASGNLKITGLPYSNNASIQGGGPNVSSQAWNLATDKNRVGVAVPTSASHIILYDNTLNGSSFPSGNVEVSDMNVAGGGFSNLLTFNITYET